MAYTTDTTVASQIVGSPTVIFDKDTDSLGPLEWEIVTDADISLFFTGAFPEKDVAVTYVAGTYHYGTPTRGITKIEGLAASTANVTIRPSVG